MYIVVMTVLPPWLPQVYLGPPRALALPSILVATPCSSTHPDDATNIEPQASTGRARRIIGGRPATPAVLPPSGPGREPAW